MSAEQQRIVLEHLNANYMAGATHMRDEDRSPESERQDDDRLKATRDACIAAATNLLKSSGINDEVDNVSYGEEFEGAGSTDQPIWIWANDPKTNTRKAYQFVDGKIVKEKAQGEW